MKHRCAIFLLTTLCAVAVAIDQPPRNGTKQRATAKPTLDNPGNNCTLCMTLSENQQNSSLLLEAEKQPTLKVECLCTKDKQTKKKVDVKTICNYFAPISEHEWFHTTEHLVANGCAKRLQFRLEIEQSNATLLLLRQDREAYVGWTHPNYGQKAIRVRGDKVNVC